MLHREARRTGVGELGPFWVSGLPAVLALLVALPLRTAITARRGTSLLR